jgi:hypothetical protein
MALTGLIYLILLFAVCFTFVHVIKLAVVGVKSLKHKPVEREDVKEQKPQPVYYIVEKKRSRKSYSKPREIEFK